MHRVHGGAARDVLGMPPCGGVRRLREGAGRGRRAPLRAGAAHQVRAPAAGLPALPRAHHGRPQRMGVVGPKGSLVHDLQLLIRIHCW